MTSLGKFRFLKDHYVNSQYINTGEIHEMFTPWVPTADVEPMDTVALAAFYAAGPQLGGVWRTVRSTGYLLPPATYWIEIAPNLWALTGLGGGGGTVTGGSFSADFNADFDIGTGDMSPLSPIAAQISRVEDKEV